jgi:hypothetical protein
MNKQFKYINNLNLSWEQPVHLHGRTPEIAASHTAFLPVSELRSLYYLEQFPRNQPISRRIVQGRCNELPNGNRIVPGNPGTICFKQRSSQKAAKFLKAIKSHLSPFYSLLAPA